MLDFKLYLMFMRVFRPRLMWTIIISVVVLVFVLANVTHLLLQIMSESWYNALAGAENSVRWIFGGRE